MRKPNILWICTDQQRYDTIHALGNSYIRTPNLDRLCREGTAFTRAYSQSPVCTPSRASFLTGCYPSRIRVNTNGNAYFPDAAPLITKRLADAGYDCGLAGKLHIASAWKGVEQRTEDGYRVFHYSHSPYHDIGGSNAYTRWIEEQGHDLNEVFVKKERKNHLGLVESAYGTYRSDCPPQLHQTYWCAEKAINFMCEPRDPEQPWLISVNILDPHPPFDSPDMYKNLYSAEDLPKPLFRPNDLDVQTKLQSAYFQSKPHPPGSREQENKTSYYGMISLIDEQVGRMLHALEDSGQRENTVIIFMSDHGEMLGDHGLTQKGCRFYEGAVRVPLILSWKGVFRENQISDELVELTDLAPTLAELANLEQRPSHGKSLIPILKGDQTPGSHRDYVRCEYYNALNMNAPYAPEKNPATFATMLRDHGWKIVIYHHMAFGELYDMEQDPDEFYNLWEEPSATDAKIALIKKAMDITVMSMDPGPPLIGRF